MRFDWRSVSETIRGIPDKYPPDREYAAWRSYRTSPADVHTRAIRSGGRGG